MAMSVNRVTLLGNVGKDPEIKNLPSGQVAASLSLATSDRIKSKDSDEWQDRTEWHNCVAYGRPAEVIRDYVRKGHKLYAEGKLTTRSWTDKNTDEKKYRTEIVLFQVVMLSSKDDHGAAASSNGASAFSDSRRGSPSGGGGYDRNSGRQQTATTYVDDDLEITDDDIPF